MLQHTQSCQCGDLAQHPSNPRFLLQHLGIEAEVEAHTLRTALFVAGGNGAEFAVPCLSTPVPALNLEGPRDQALPASPIPAAWLCRSSPHLLPRLWVDHCLLVKVERAFLILYSKDIECGVGWGTVSLGRV